MNRRRAFSLVELVTAVTAASTLMLVAIGTLHRAMEFASNCRSRAEDNRNLTRLADQFRTDVHHARSCNMDVESKLQLVLIDATQVTYQTERNRISREQPLPDGSNRREVFALRESLDCKLHLLEEPKRAVLTITRDVGAKNSKLRIERLISAVVGRMISSQGVGNRFRGNDFDRMEALTRENDSRPLYERSGATTP